MDAVCLIYAQVIINTEVRSIPVTKKGVYFAFRDQGACISLLAIRVYYITCPEVTASFAVFPATPTGRELTSIEQSNGVCVANAVEETPPKYLCKGDGNWYLLGGGCLCKPGYEANTEKQTCNGKHWPVSLRLTRHPPQFHRLAGQIDYRWTMSDDGQWQHCIAQLEAFLSRRLKKDVHPFKATRT